MKSETPPRQSATAAAIRDMARQHDVQYVGTDTDTLAHHITRLAGDTVILDDVEQTLLALQRAGHLSRRDVVHLQARYLREAGL
jgi:hypothetical protein